MSDEDHVTTECPFLKVCDVEEQWNFLTTEKACAKCIGWHPETTCPEIDARHRGHCQEQHHKILKCGAVPFDPKKGRLPHTTPLPITFAKSFGVCHPGMSWHPCHEATLKPHADSASHTHRGRRWVKIPRRPKQPCKPPLGNPRDPC